MNKNIYVHIYIYIYIYTHMAWTSSADLATAALIFSFSSATLSALSSREVSDCLSSWSHQSLRSIQFPNMYMFNSNNLKLRVSNPRAIAGFPFKMPSESSNLPVSEQTFEDRPRVIPRLLVAPELVLVLLLLLVHEAEDHLLDLVVHLSEGS